MKNANTRNFVIWGVVIALLLAMVTAASSDIQASNTTELTYTQLKERVEDGSVESAIIDVDKGMITGTLNGEEKYRTYIGPYNLDADEVFEGSSIPYEFKEQTKPNMLGSALIGILPLLIIGGLFLLFFRNMQGGGRGGAMSFGKSKARLFTGDKPTVTFEDVAGVEEAKEELSEIVEFLKEPEKFVALGARIPKGLSLIHI